MGTRNNESFSDSKVNGKSAGTKQTDVKEGSLDGDGERTNRQERQEDDARRGGSESRDGIRLTDLSEATEE